MANRRYGDSVPPKSLNPLTVWASPNIYDPFDLDMARFWMTEYRYALSTIPTNANTPASSMSPRSKAR
jgi:hypothetical protein